jgi:hypothetical protein
MARLTPSILLSLALAAPAVFAAEPAATKKTDEPALPAALAAPKPANPAPTTGEVPRARTVSPSVAAILATQVPKFDPNAPKPKSRLDPSELPATTDTQNPANKIIRLPEYMVLERRNGIPNETVVLTKKGLEEMAYKRYINSEIDRALNRFTLPFFGTSAKERAVQMYREDERLRNMADVADMARIASLTDAAAGMYIKKVGDQTYMRTSDFGYQGGKSPDGNR